MSRFDCHWSVRISIKFECWAAFISFYWINVATSTARFHGKSIWKSMQITDYVKCVSHSVDNDDLDSSARRKYFFPKPEPETQTIEDKLFKLPSKRKTNCLQKHNRMLSNESFMSFSSNAWGVNVERNIFIPHRSSFNNCLISIWESLYLQTNIDRSWLHNSLTFNWGGRLISKLFLSILFNLLNKDEDVSAIINGTNKADYYGWKILSCTNFMHHVFMLKHWGFPIKSLMLNIESFVRTALTNCSTSATFFALKIVHELLKRSFMVFKPSFIIHVKLVLWEIQLTWDLCLLSSSFLVVLRSLKNDVNYVLQRFGRGAKLIIETNISYDLNGKRNSLRYFPRNILLID